MGKISLCVRARARVNQCMIEILIVNTCTDQKVSQSIQAYIKYTEYNSFQSTRSQFNFLIL